MATRIQLCGLMVLALVAVGLAVAERVWPSSPGVGTVYLFLGMFGVGTCSLGVTLLARLEKVERLAADRKRVEDTGEAGVGRREA